MTVYGEEHDVQSHKFRPTITDMQDKYCGDCNVFTLFKANTKETAKKMWRGRRPRRLFCGGGRRPPALYIDFEQG